MSNLYQDAILDAKALRASAMANAKAALEEAFEPKIQEMISKHLSEEAVEEEIEEEYGMEEEGYNEEAKMHGKDHEKMEEADINETELEEILGQLEEMESSEALNEAEEEEEETEEEEEEEESAEETEGVSDETKVIEITVGDLKEILKSVMPGQEMPAAEEESTADSEKEEEVSLEEILAELEHDGAESVHDVAHNGTGYEAGQQSHTKEEAMDKEMEEGVRANQGKIPAQNDQVVVIQIDSPKGDTYWEMRYRYGIGSGAKKSKSGVPVGSTTQSVGLPVIKKGEGMSAEATDLKKKLGFNAYVIEIPGAEPGRETYAAQIGFVTKRVDKDGQGEVFTLTDKEMQSLGKYAEGPKGNEQKPGFFSRVASKLGLKEQISSDADLKAIATKATKNPSSLTDEEKQALLSVYSNLEKSGKIPAFISSIARRFTGGKKIAPPTMGEAFGLDMYASEIFQFVGWAILTLIPILGGIFGYLGIKGQLPTQDKQGNIRPSQGIRDIMPEGDEELQEARETIEALRKDLQEVNLLNAKYLYMNKLFKSKNLTESQKLKVINTFDQATSVKEVKTAYEIMNESFSINKGQLKESVGFASKPAGVAPKANIVEADQFINRWQKLAGIKK